MTRKQLINNYWKLNALLEISEDPKPIEKEMLELAAILDDQFDYFQ